MDAEPVILGDGALPDGLPTTATGSEATPETVLAQGSGARDCPGQSVSAAEGPQCPSTSGSRPGPLIAPPVAQPPEWGPRPRRWWGAGRSSCLASCLLHAVALIVLALVTFAAPRGTSGPGLVASLSPSVPPEAIQSEHLVPLEVDPADRALPWEIPQMAPTVNLPAETPEADEGDGIGLARSLPANLLAEIGRGGLGDRSPRARAALVGKGGDGGPTGASEEAVERGLRWLVAHQLPDGSWHFNHHDSLCQGICRNPGTVATTTGATAMALLAFLGAGYTHQSGEHQEVVRRGLYYLQSRAIVADAGIDLQEGTMYAQGLASIALSEACAMTDDRTLRAVAQGAVDFIVAAQDQQGGGWRYQPHQPGDTTVTGWQIMALKSAEMAGLDVPQPALFRAQEFLTSVQAEYGAQYGYMSTQARQTTTAIGLLCRMFGGWGHDHEALQRGVAYLARWGPSEQDIYYNYYATQVMFHWQGSDWKRWNEHLRDYLVATQATRGHEAGSWFFTEERIAPGGRLCSTALAIMTLEVYYRYLPLYGPRAFRD